MTSTFVSATFTYIIGFLAAPPVDIDGTTEPVPGLLLSYRGSRIIRRMALQWRYVSSSYISLLYRSLLLFRSLMGIIIQTWYATMDICRIFYSSCRSFYSRYRLSNWFSDDMPLGISGTFNCMLVFQAKHKILMHPLHRFGVASVFEGSLFSAMHGSLVTSSFLNEAD